MLEPFSRSVRTHGVVLASIFSQFAVGWVPHPTRSIAVEVAAERDWLLVVAMESPPFATNMLGVEVARNASACAEPL